MSYKLIIIKVNKSATNINYRIRTNALLQLLTTVEIFKHLTQLLNVRYLQISVNSMNTRNMAIKYLLFVLKMFTISH